MAQEVFEKRGAGLEGEAAALAWIGQAEAQGGMRVARVLEASDTRLLEELVFESAPTQAMARAAGEALARTHAAGAPAWGCPPPGWSGSYAIGHSETPCSSGAETPASWGAFFARYRIRAYMGQLPNGFFSADEARVLERVCERLEAGELDAAQPALVGAGPARVHGDLWAGNLLWSAESPTGGVLIDPMAHGGHAEEDLAMLALFGCAHLDELIAAYDSVSPLAAGWQERVPLMQLAPLLHHCVLFGRGYARQSLLAARRCLA